MKCKSEKYLRQIQDPVRDLKMELHVKIVNDFKLETIFAKSNILDVLQVLSSVLTTINQTFLTNKIAVSRFFVHFPRFFLPKHF